jgi:hypothetical protein
VRHFFRSLRERKKLQARPRDSDLRAGAAGETADFAE